MDSMIKSRNPQDCQGLSMEEELEKIVEEELAPTKRRLLEVQDGLHSVRGTLSEVVEELESTKQRLRTRINRMINDRTRKSSSSRRRMKLMLRNEISRTILPGEEIKGEDNTSIQVALVDDFTGHVVNVEPESSMNVEIVVLKGEFDALLQGQDWTVESFEHNMLPEMEGKKPLLKGDVRVKLQKGVANLDNIKLRHRARTIRPSKFRLGVRAFDAFDRARVKEALTEFFIVKDFRNKYFKKHKTPSLCDKVCRLVNIGKGGPIDKRLESYKVCTVEDFLTRLLIDTEGLKSSVNLGAKKWEATVNNARACPDHKRIYCYINSKTGVVFNIMGRIRGLYLENQYFTTTMLSENQKVDAQELLACACKNWEHVIHFDDEESLQQHFTSLNTFVDSRDFLEPDHYVAVGESSNRHSSSSFDQRKISAVDWGTEEDFVSFNNYDLDLIYNLLHEDNDYVNMSNDDGEMSARHVEFVGPIAGSDVSKGSKMWIVFYNVSRWYFSIKRLVSTRGNNPKTKKRKGC